MIAPVDNLLKRIASDREALSRAERQVADIVLDRPTDLLYASLAELSAQAQVSEPTVLRFCRSIGCDGYQDFKVRLAQSLASHFPYADLAIEPDDGVRDYAVKVLNGTLDTVLQLRSNLDFEAIDSAVDLLRSASKIEFFGVGASGAVALDAHHKFFRLGVPCVAYSDSHMQYMSAATMGPGDVVVAISHTGRTRELLESVQLARESGAAILAITAGDSPLAREAQLLIQVDVPEDTDLYTPMTSRIAHLVVIDVLALGVALAGSDTSVDRLRRIKDRLRHKRLPREDQ